MIGWPLAPFGIFVDNSLICKAQNQRINFITKPRAQPKKLVGSAKDLQDGGKSD